MALHRSIQSVVWYYASCTPCAEARYREKLKKKSERDRLERETIYSMMPHVYRHPSPSGTNAHWQNEIETGPHLVARGKKRANTADTRGRPRTSLTQQSEVSNARSSFDLSSASDSRDGRNDSKFDFKSFQRDNEAPHALSSRDRQNSNISWSSNGITKPPKARMRGADGEAPYSNYRNPQISDLHPATVTKFNSREEAQWMMKPLPNPDFMKGREGTRERSNSGDSSRASAKSPVMVSRQTSERTMERKPKTTDDFLAPHSAIASLKHSRKSSTASQTNVVIIEDKDAPPGASISTDGEATQAMPIQIRVSDNSNESDVTIVHTPDRAPKPLRTPQSRKTASKPQLSTIVSDSTVPHDENGSHTSLELPKENSNPSSRHSDTSIDQRDRISRRSPIVPEDESLKILRDLAPQSAIFNTKVVSTDDLLRASKKTSRHPSQASEEKFPDFDPEILESLDTAESALPDWIHEHTKREVKERWSMDI